MVLLLAFLPLRGQLGPAEYPVQVAVLAAFLWFFSRKQIDLKVTNWAGSIGLGVAVFLFWIGPDLLFPGYRAHWLFTNSIVGQPGSTVAPEWRGDWLVLIMRTIKAAILVAIIEELFWRGWLMRWLIKPDFQSLPLGVYQLQSFAITAVLFALEHGSYWEVGLLTGILYNWWMVRTKSLGDLILTHGVTNLVLSLHVILHRQWQYWS
jgi:CAAX prenyl protease-like protein